MSRYLYNQQVLAKIETTPGVLVTTALADAVLIKNVKVTFPDEGDPRDLMRGYTGGSELLAGARRMELTFTTEMFGGGTAGTANAWGILLRACGMAENALTSPSRVEYNPISAAMESLSFGFINDGVKYTARYGRGSWKMNFAPFKAPTIDWTFWAIDTTGATGANPASTFSSWTAARPLVVSDSNTSSLKVGGSYAAGVITSGTPLAWDSFTVDLNNTLDHVLLVGSAEAIDIGGRAVKGSVSAFLDAAAEVQWRTDWLANTLFSFSLQHGTTAGNKAIIHGASVQKTNVQPVATKNRLMTTADLGFNPTGAGSNDLVVVLL